MPQLNRDILRQVFDEIVKSDGNFENIDKFMLSGKEPFNLVLDICREANDVVFLREKVVAKMPGIEYKQPPSYRNAYQDLDKSVLGTEILTSKMKLFKPISIALASSLTSLDLRTFSPELIPMLKAIDKEVKIVHIQNFNNQLEDILKGCVNIPNVRDGVTIRSCRFCGFADGMKFFAIPCHKLAIEDVDMNKIPKEIDLDNPYLRNVRDLTVKGNFEKNWKYLNHVKQFATFLSTNFPNLETFNANFSVEYSQGICNWDWNDNRMANFYKRLSPRVKGSVCYKIGKYGSIAIDRNKYPDVQSDGDTYFKVFPVTNNISLKLLTAFNAKLNDNFDYEPGYGYYEPDDYDSVKNGNYHSSFWEKRNKNVQHNFENNGNKEFKEKWKQTKNSNKDSSTLPLHIAAYENSLDVVCSNVADKEQQKKIIKNFKKWKNAKQIFTNKSSLVQDPYCFPRQQKQQQNTESEIAKFKASEVPLNLKCAARGHAKQGNAGITRNQANGTRKSERIKNQQNAEKQEDTDSTAQNKSKLKPKRHNLKRIPLTCYNAKGQPVDWFLIIKTDQCEYYYIDSQMLADGKTKMIRFDNIFSKDSPLYRTMSQFYDNQDNENFLAMIFNDEHTTPPPKQGVAHQKGMVFCEGEYGLYISHSVPYLPFVDENRFPGTARRKGQHVFGANIYKEALKPISKHLWYTHPDIYFPKILKVPDEFDTIEELNEISLGNFCADFKEFETDEIKTRGGYNFTIHSRSHSKEKEREYSSSLWDRIAIEYRQSFFVQTYYSEGQQCNECSKENYKIYNIEGTQAHDTLRICTKGMDHAKIGFGEKSQHFCLGDLNHTKSKLTRGGSIIVIPDAKLVKAYDNTFHYKILSG